VSVKKQYLPWLVCAVMFVVGVPALASGSEPAPIDAAFDVHDNTFDDAAGGPNDHDVTITAGGKVTFTYAVEPGNNAVHNADFSTGPAPTRCVQTAAGTGYEIDPDTDAPLPDNVQGPGWTGYCTFATPGTYTFFCDAHGGMEGTITVTGDATPTSTPTGTATPTSTGTATPTPPAAAARVDAHETATRNWWQERGQPDTDNTVTIKPGERVAFAYPTGGSIHNVAFEPGPAPTSCPQTKAANGLGLDPDDAPPLPAIGFAVAPGWEGYCTFPTTGTYSFVCGVHPEMKGAVVVQTDPTPTATATATETATPPPAPPKTVLPAAPTPAPTSAPTVTTKVATASFKRSKRTLTISGTTTATGKVKVKLTYKVGKKTRTKTASLTVKGGKFSGKLKLSAADAKKASKLSVTVTAAGASTKKTVSVKK
jgi:plastocyanin